MKNIKFALLVLALLVGTSALAAWSEPTSAPPGGNTPEPINVSNSNQMKTGWLGLGGLILSAVQNLNFVTPAPASQFLTTNSAGEAVWATPTATQGPQGPAGPPGPSGGGVGGSGTANYLPKWTAGTTLGNSQIVDDGAGVSIVGNLGTHGYSSTMPAGWGGGVNTWDVWANASTRTHNLCLGGGVNSSSLGDCRSSWPTGGGGGTTPNLQQVTDVGASTNRAITTTGLTSYGNVGIGAGSLGQGRLEVYGGNIQMRGGFTLDTTAGDFRMGGEFGRPGGRALVAYYDGLHLNYGPDWNDTIVDSNLKVNRRLAIMDTPPVFGGTTMCLALGGLVGMCPSSIKYKENILPLNDGLKIISQLNPVTFNWKESKGKDFGLIAEEVEKVSPQLATYDSKGEIVGVKYEKIGVLTINALKEQQKQIEELKSLVCADHPEAAVCKTD